MEAWSRASLVALAVALVALTGCARERSGDVREGAGGPDAVKVSMRHDAFVPDELRLEAGTEVRVEVRNQAGSRHNFTIDELDLSTGTMEPGTVRTATFVVPNGRTDYHCTFHPGMGGVIVPR